MTYASIDEWIKEFYDYAVEAGFPREVFFSQDNCARYVDTAIDGYRDYPLFCSLFGGRYNAEQLTKMMTVDFTSRLRKAAGIASSAEYESVILIEPPHAKKESLRQYAKVARLSDYAMLLKPATYRQEAYESYATKKREAYMDDRTWYMYVFATRLDMQHKGYGKKLMNLICAFARDKGYRICLETNLDGNIAMYEHFGFKLMDSSTYKGKMGHYVLLFG